MLAVLVLGLVALGSNGAVATRFEIFIAPPSFALDDRALDEYLAQCFVALLSDPSFVQETATAVMALPATDGPIEANVSPLRRGRTGYLVTIRGVSARDGREVAAELVERAERSLSERIRRLLVNVIEERELALNAVQKRRRFEESVGTAATVARRREEELSLELERLRHQLEHPERVVRSTSPVTVPRMATGTEGRTMAAVVIALMVVLGLGAWASTSARRRRSHAYVQRHAGLPVLGVIPHLDDELPLRRSAYGAGAEAFRAIRTELITRSCRRLVVVAWGHGEGTTTIAANLALAFAECGQRILLVDGNLRRPALHRLFAVSNDVGLSDALLDTPVHELWWHAPDASVTFLAAGPRPPDPAALFVDRRWQAVASSIVAAEHDVLIVDSPALAAAADVLKLANVADAVIVVVRPGMEPPEQVTAAIRRMGKAGLPLVGLVCNDADVAAASQRAYGHRYA